jgi:hypothetical protein
VLPIDQLIAAQTEEQIKASVYDLLTTLGFQVTAWQEGGAARTLIAVFCRLLAALYVLIGLANRSNFLDLASGDWLKHRAIQNYGIASEDLAATRGTTTLDLVSASYVGTLDPGEIVAKNSVTGALYQNTATVAITAGNTANVAIEALDIGSAGTSLAGEIDTLVTALPGVTSVSNPTAAVGLDGLTDEEIRQLCRDSLGRLSPLGPEAAYVYWAKVAKRQNGERIGVNRVWVSPSGVPVQVYVATASGAVTGTVGDLSTDLGCVDDSVQEGAVTNPVTCVVDSATDKVVNVALTVYVDQASNLTDDEIDDLIGTALSGAGGFFTSGTTAPIGGLVIPPAGGKVYVGAIEQWSKAASPYFFRVVVATPSADVAVAEGEVPIMGSLTITKTRITLPS